MEQILSYVKPELLTVAVVLYFAGIFLKQAETVSDKYIPGILGVLGMVICGIYVFATSTVSNAITQGILVAGLSNYVNQIIKQASKEE